MQAERQGLDETRHGSKKAAGRIDSVLLKHELKPTKDGHKHI